MGKLYYKKAKKKDKRKIVRLFGLVLFLTGIFIIIFIFWPLISWQIYFAPVFASQNIAIPIPKTTIVSRSTIQSLLAQASSNLAGVDYTNAQNWFPNYKYQKPGKNKNQVYTVSIPKLNINNALTSAADYDLSKHLVNYAGTALPPDKGNAVVFGHSTLPQLYDAKNYKTVFTYLYQLGPGDEIVVNRFGTNFKYKVENIIVVDPDNTSVLEQDYSDSFLTLVTCTPPGTIWKRLVVKARIEKI